MKLNRCLPRTHIKTASLNDLRVMHVAHCNDKQKVTPNNFPQHTPHTPMRIRAHTCVWGRMRTPTRCSCCRPPMSCSMRWMPARGTEEHLRFSSALTRRDQRQRQRPGPADQKWSGAFSTPRSGIEAQSLSRQTALLRKRAEDDPRDIFRARQPSRPGRDRCFATRSPLPSIGSGSSRSSDNTIQGRKGPACLGSANRP
jgi:hypothetical protein